MGPRASEDPWASRTPGSQGLGLRGPGPQGPWGPKAWASRDPWASRTRGPWGPWDPGWVAGGSRAPWRDPPEGSDDGNDDGNDDDGNDGNDDDGNDDDGNEHPDATHPPSPRAQG